MAARTQEEGARQVQGWFEAEGWETRLAFINEYYVHIDLMVVPIAPKLRAVCLDCTLPAIVDWLRGKGHEIIDVPFPYTMALGCNFMSLGCDRVIAPAVSKLLIGQLRARGGEVAAIDISEILKTRGRHSLHGAGAEARGGGVIWSYQKLLGGGAGLVFNRGAIKP